MSSPGLAADILRGTGGPSPCLAYTVGTGQQLQLGLLSCQLTTDTTAAGHVAELLVANSPSGTLLRLPDTSDLAANSAVQLTFGVGLPESRVVAGAGQAVTLPLPDIIIPEGSTLTLRTLSWAGAVVTGDVFANVVMVGNIIELGSILSPADSSPNPLLVPSS